MERNQGESIERRANKPVRILAPSLGAALVVALAQVTGGAVEVPNSAGKSPAGQLKREGAQLVDVLGHFRMTGDRATFYPLQSQASYAGLENLALERVTALIIDNADQPTWQVSGTITEFRGRNFLLVTRAILKSDKDAETAQPRRASARGDATRP